MRGELYPSLLLGQRNLEDLRPLADLLLWFEAELLCALLLPLAQVRRGDSLHSVNLKVERVTSGQGILNPASKSG